MALIRYPGSKERLSSQIAARLPDEISLQLVSSNARWEYREPFFGAGAVGFDILRHVDQKCGVWLNDIDPGMASLWSAVRDHSDELIELIRNFRPTTDAFYQFKEEDGRLDLPLVMAGFRKLALHRISFSGLGAMAAGPIGGRNQGQSDYDVGCRWNPVRLEQEVSVLGRRLRKYKSLRFTNLDFGQVIQDASHRCFIYADPPYYKQGPSLYKHAMRHEDHVRLADLLRESRATWILSYDDHEMIRDLYSWANIETVDVTYTVVSAAKKRPANREIIITPQGRYACD